MSLLYVSCVMIINATTGDKLEEYCRETPVTLKQCSEQNIEYGPVLAMYDKAAVLYCRKIEDGVET